MRGHHASSEKPPFSLSPFDSDRFVQSAAIIAATPFGTLPTLVRPRPLAECHRKQLVWIARLTH
jgi:hypothetical protein